MRIPGNRIPVSAPRNPITPAVDFLDLTSGLCHSSGVTDCTAAICNVNAKSFMSSDFVGAFGRGEGWGVFEGRAFRMGEGLGFNNNQNQATEGN